MIEFLVVGLASAAPFAVAYAAQRGDRQRLEHTNAVYLQLLADEKLRVESLTRLLMSREAPAEYAAYIAPQSLAEEFPEDALWDDSGLYYTTGSEV